MAWAVIWDGLPGVGIVDTEFGTVSGARQIACSTIAEEQWGRWARLPLPARSGHDRSFNNSRSDNMIPLSIGFVGIGLILLLGMLYGAIVGDVHSFQFRSACQGQAWRRAFPNASKESIRSFLQVFVDAFAFPTSQRLAFNPDDAVCSIYKKLYPSKWIPDAMEVEVFANELEKRWGVRLESMWSEKLTLGEIFATVERKH